MKVDHSVFIQRQVRENAQDVENFILDLKSWEEGIKKQEQKVSKSSGDNSCENVRKPVTRGDVDYVKSVFEDGVRQMKNGKWELAVASFSKAIKKYNKNPMFFIKRAKCHLKLKKPKEAESDCSAALTLDPKILKAKFYRSKAREMTNNLRGACLDLQDIVVLDPANLTAKSALEKLKPIYLASMGITNSQLFEEEAPSKEICVLDVLSGSDAENAELEERIMKASIQKELGNKYVKDERWEDAKDAYSKAILLHPSDAIFHANRALCHMKTGNMERAVFDCSMALKQNPRYVKAYLRRAAARKETGDLWGARQDCKQLIQLEPGNNQAKSSLEELNILIEQKVYADYRDLEVGDSSSEDDHLHESAEELSDQEFFEPQLSPRSQSNESEKPKNINKNAKKCKCIILKNFIVTSLDLNHLKSLILKLFHNFLSLNLSDNDVEDVRVYGDNTNSLQSQIVLVKFSRCELQVMVLQKSHLLSETEVSISAPSQKLSREILLPYYKQAKENKIPAYLFRSKLFICGKGYSVENISLVEQVIHKKSSPILVKQEENVEEPCCEKKEIMVCNLATGIKSSHDISQSHLPQNSLDHLVDMFSSGSSITKKAKKKKRSKLALGKDMVSKNDPLFGNKSNKQCIMKPDLDPTVAHANKPVPNSKKDTYKTNKMKLVEQVIQKKSSRNVADRTCEKGVEPSRGKEKNIIKNRTAGEILLNETTQSPLSREDYLDFLGSKFSLGRSSLEKPEEKTKSKFSIDLDNATKNYPQLGGKTDEDEIMKPNLDQTMHSNKQTPKSKKANSYKNYKMKKIIQKQNESEKTFLKNDSGTNATKLKMLNNSSTSSNNCLTSGNHLKNSTINDEESLETAMRQLVLKFGKEIATCSNADDKSKKHKKKRAQAKDFPSSNLANSTSESFDKGPLPEFATKNAARKIAVGISSKNNLSPKKP